MTSIPVVLAFMVAAQHDPAIEGKTLFAVFERYHSSFRDISFLYEVTHARLEATAGKEPDPANVRRSQGLYAYRSDGATVWDVFGQGRGNKPVGRMISAILHNRLERLNASPDSGPAVRDRVPEVAPGGPGVLAGPDSPERIFLAYYFPTLVDPSEHEIEFQGWENISGHRCLKVRMLKQPRPLLKGWVGGLPFVKLWVDLERDGCPLRYELYRGNDLEVRTEVTRLERLTLPDGRHLWLPVTGKTMTFLGQEGPGRIVHTKEPVSVEDYGVLVETVKFDQGLSDGFFSAKKHALVANDEGLRKLQRELEKTPKPQMKRLPADPESRQKRLDEALAEADRQAQRLEASSAARAGVGWFEALYGGLGMLGVLAIGGASFWYWRGR